MNEIFLYGGVYSYSVQNIIEQMNEFGEDADITYRTNSGGGDVFAAQGWLASMKKRSGKNIQSMEGNSSSMAFFSALYMDEVTALETSKCLVHRAAAYVYNDEDKRMLKEVNESFMEAMKAKIDVAAFEKRAGVTLEEFFNPGADYQTRHEVWLNSQDLVSIGLVKAENVLKLTPELAASLPQTPKVIFSEYREQVVLAEQSQLQENIINTNTDTIMELTADQAVAQERERVAAWNVWAKVDADKVLAGIASGKSITPAESQEFMLALANSNNLATIEKNSPAAVTTTVEPTATVETVNNEQAQIDAILAEMGVSKEVK